MKDPDTGKGYYYLFLSYGYFNSNGGYNMRIFRSDKPDGPYLDQNGNSAIFPGGGDNIGANICQWEYWDGDGQKFILEPAAQKAENIKGDVNADGVFSVSDIVLLQKWFLSVPDTNLSDWKAGDLCEDNHLDILDLCMMKSMLVENN